MRPSFLHCRFLVRIDHQGKKVREEVPNILVALQILQSVDVGPVKPGDDCFCIYELRNIFLAHTIYRQTNPTTSLSSSASFRNPS